jgi:hypothetical protein
MKKHGYRQKAGQDVLNLSIIETNKEKLEEKLRSYH